ncbi:hypothetical protein, partial [Pyramidobacter sp. CG50-2]|uniref:hypothetical protein n=1 Tax=Pyramidobacter sp. CG50-2 TaxID=2382160 RepID=UPI0011C406C3
MAGDTLEFAGINYVQTSYDAAAKKLTVGLDTTALNSQINNQVNSNTTVTQHGTDITALKNGFTVSNAAGTKQDITLGGATKKNIKFEGETDKIDVTVAADGADGAKVTVTANANLGTNLDISNNATVTNLSNTVSGNTANIATNTSNITKLQGGFDLKAGSTTNNVALGGATAPTVEFAGADDTVTVDLTGTKVTYGIDKTKLITQLNNNSTTITNVEAKFKLADEGTGTTTVTADKTGTQTVKFAGDGNIIESEVGTAGVKYKVNTANLTNTINTAITNNTTVQNLAGGFNVKAGANTGAIQAGNTLEFAGKNYVEVEYDSTAKKMTIGLDDATKNKIDNLSTTINNASKWTIKDGETPAGEKEINSTTPLVVKGAGGVTTKVDAGGLTIGLNGANLSNTINNSFTVINNVEAKFKIADAGT